MIKLVCLDLDGVVFSSSCFREFKSYLATQTPYPDRIDDVLHGERMDAYKSGKETDESFIGYAILELGLHWGIGDWEREIGRFYAIQTEVLELIRSLRSSGIKIGFCTNNFPVRIRAIEAQTHFLDYFDAKILSYEIGALKPDQKIFQALVDKSGCAANEIFYADDNAQKLAGARALGIIAEEINSNAALIERIKDLT